MIISPATHRQRNIHVLQHIEVLAEEEAAEGSCPVYSVEEEAEYCKKV